MKVLLSALVLISVISCTKKSAVVEVVDAGVQVLESTQSVSGTDSAPVPELKSESK